MGRKKKPSKGALHERDLFRKIRENIMRLTHFITDAETAAARARADQEQKAKAERASKADEARKARDEAKKIGLTATMQPSARASNEPDPSDKAKEDKARFERMKIAQMVRILIQY